MQSRFLETSEGFSYCQVPDYVESHEVVPGNDILRSVLGIFVQAGDEEINVLFDQRLLFSKSFVGECVAQESSVATVVRIIFYRGDTESIQHFGIKIGSEFTSLHHLLG